MRDGSNEGSVLIILHSAGVSDGTDGKDGTVGLKDVLPTGRDRILCFKPQLLSRVSVYVANIYHVYTRRYAQHSLICVKFAASPDD